MARPAVKRQVVEYVIDHYATSRRRACRVVCQHRSVQYYRSRKDPKLALPDLTPVLVPLAIRVRG